ncbi:hypothetical protein L5515_016834 [Caenorhabditis briggsae]|nr:hypothetical protein L5515_016834 [Caenorhabditis briggsae]
MSQEKQLTEGDVVWAKRYVGVLIHRLGDGIWKVKWLALLATTTFGECDENIFAFHKDDEMPQPVGLPEHYHRNAVGIAREYLRLRNTEWGSEAKRIVSPEFVELTGLVRHYDPDVYYDALESLESLDAYEFVDAHRVCNCYEPKKESIVARMASWTSSWLQ